MKEYLDQALNAQHGIEIETKNASTLRGKLYKEKKTLLSLGFTQYKNLKFRLAPTDQQTKLWIMKNGST